MVLGMQNCCSTHLGLHCSAVLRKQLHQAQSVFVNSPKELVSNAFWILGGSFVRCVPKSGRELLFPQLFSGCWSHIGKSLL